MVANTSIDPSQTAAGPRTVTLLAVRGMNCGNCARRVTETLQRVSGVQSAAVNLEAEQATIRWSPTAAPNAPEAIRALAEAGYPARLVVSGAPAGRGQMLAGWGVNLWIGAPVTLVLMVGEWALGWGMARWFQWLSFGLAAVVQVFAGARFYRGAWGQLKAGSSNMDTLVALGSTTAFGYSAWALWCQPAAPGHGHVYFMEAAAIITLISLGHWLESMVSARASSALRQLLHLAPPTARRRGADGEGVEVPVSALRVGDEVVLRPGDRVPTDGVVVAGESAVDESTLTGESVPVDKGIGQGLYAGTTTLNSRLVMRVTATGEATALAHIIASVQRAQASRANIQRLGDRVSSVFVPVVLVLAVAAACWWGLAPASARQVHAWLGQFLWAAAPAPTDLAAAFLVAAGVLIVACPCAMGLATPAAIMAAANAAARRGILIRDGVALEKAGQVTTVLFDKTGTLTAGKPSVVAVWEAPATAEASQDGLQPPAVDLAAALAAESSHPISQALARQTHRAGAITGWHEVRGAGVVATLAQPHPVSVRLGSMRWLRECGVTLPESHSFLQQWSGQGATLVGLAVGQSLRGLFALQDTLKPGAEAVVAQLRREGLRLGLVTGDNALTAAAIARQVGLEGEEVFAELRPEQKAALIQRLQGEGERVAFVGDGINDAPALEQADLGVAVSRASDIAREAADIILLKSEIEAVPESLGLARASLRVIRQNLFWAFFYNAIGIPLAAMGFLSPILCAAAMGLSDLVVVGNALRLRRYRNRWVTSGGH